MQQMADNWLIEDAMLLQQCLSSAANNYATSVAVPKKLDDAELRRMQIAISLLDSSALGVICTMLGISHCLSGFRAESFREEIERLRWDSPKSIYKHSFPRSVLKQIEWLTERMGFEQACEGTIRTPLWYTSQVASLGLVRSLHELLSLALGRLDSDILQPVKRLISEGKALFASHLIGRGLEACNKATLMLDHSENCYKELLSLRKASDIPWTDFDTAKLRDNVLCARTGLLKSLATLSPIIAGTPSTDKLPDYFGQAYSVLAEETYQSLSKGDDTLFAILFEAIVTLAASAPDRLAGTLKGQPDKTRIIFQTETIADLFALSGYALLYGELLGKDSWKIVIKAWDKLLTEVPDAKASCQYLASVAAFRQNLFALSPRDLIRSEWEIKLTRTLSEQGILGQYDPFSPNREKRHASKYINSLGNFDFLAYHAQDYFFAEYLFRRTELAGTVIPRKAKDLTKWLARRQELDEGVDPNAEDVEEDDDD